MMVVVVVVIISVRLRMMIVFRTSKKLFKNWNRKNLTAKLNDNN